MPRPVVAVVTAQIGAAVPISAVQRQRLFGTAKIQHRFDVFAVLVLQGFERGPLDSHVDRLATQISSLQVLAREHIVSFCHLRFLSSALALPGNKPPASYSSS